MWHHHCPYSALAGDKSARRPTRKQTSRAACPQDGHRAQSSRKDPAKGSPRPGSSRKKQTEHGSYHKGLRGQKPRKVERSPQGRKKDRRTSLKEQRTSPKKERETLRKETGKQLRKPRCAVALIESLSAPLPSSCLCQGWFSLWERSSYCSCSYFLRPPQAECPPYAGFFLAVPIAREALGVGGGSSTEWR